MALEQDNSRGYAALRDGAALVRVGRTGRILLTGADRRSYLQGLLTNDIEALRPGTGCYAAMLTAQGRMIADMRVLELGDAVMLDVPAEVAAAIRDHLDRFVIAEDVTVQEVTASRAEMGLYGPRAIEVLAAAGTQGGAPAALYASTRGRIAGVDVLIVRSDATGVRGFDLIASAAGAPAVEEALFAAGAIPATDADVETVRIESGRPRFGADMDSDTIPLEAGLEDRAISRTKGCYVGQEVIVRVLDRGHGRVARRLVGLTLAADAPVPAADAKIRSAEKDAGRVTSAVFSPALARPIALAYVHRDFSEPGTRVQVDGAGDAVVAALPLVPLE
ncbi:MAG TPA: glycine cleavage T C-terminal barrel domain-containing protein [Vicinamibacterales bacterium]|nr:glycine cleavage T C-terminal barrel domain-containing protein [Vicinamibacterales bacterium]